MATSAKTSKARKKSGPGRPPENRLGEDLAVYHAFMRPGAVTSAEDLAQLLRITPERAEEILDEFKKDSSENFGALIPSTDRGEGDGKLTLPRPLESTHGLRLTQEQADACSNALDRLGFDADDERRVALEEALFPKDYERRNKVECEPVSKETRDVLLVFARSMCSAKSDPQNPGQVRQRLVEFQYKGKNDHMSKPRQLAPFSLEVGQEGIWHVWGYDYDAKTLRSFELNDIVINEGSPRLLGDKDDKNPRHIPFIDTRASDSTDDSHVVCVACDPEVQGRLLSIEGAKLVKYEDESHGGWTLVELPYFRADWLPRQLIALGSKVKIIANGSDKETVKELRREVRRLAKGDCAHHEALMKKRTKR